MEHGIVPRFTRCPTAYCAPSRQGVPVAATDVIALREHAAALKKPVFLGRRRNETPWQYAERKRREGR